MKLYKSITFGLMALALGGSMASCSDFLDEELTTQQNTDYFDTEEGIDQLAIGMYYNLRFHFGKEWAYATTNYGTDEFTVGGDGSNKVWNNYDGSSSHKLWQPTPILQWRKALGQYVHRYQ